MLFFNLWINPEIYLFRPHFGMDFKKDDGMVMAFSSFRGEKGNAFWLTVWVWT